MSGSSKGGGNPFSGLFKNAGLSTKDKDPLGLSLDPRQRSTGQFLFSRPEAQAAGKGVGTYVGDRLSSPSPPDIELNIPAEEPVEPVPVYAQGQYDVEKASRAAPPGGLSSISDELKKKKGYKSNLFAGAKGAKISETSLLRKKLGSVTKLGTS